MHIALYHSYRTPSSFIEQIEITPVITFLILYLFTAQSQTIRPSTVTFSLQSSGYPTSVKALIDAIECIKQTNISFTRFLNTDAARAAHFAILEQRIRALVPAKLPPNQVGDFRGPWLEDLWNDLPRLNLVEFGHFIPLFVPWNRIWLMGGEWGAGPRYRKIARSILNLLSPNFLYVTVSQNDDGLEGRDDSFPLPPNLFVLSQGGKGHVPLLLWRKQMNPADYLVRREYEFDVLFMGSSKTHAIRSRMINIVQKVFPNSSFVSAPVMNWVNQYEKAKLILCPRGWGRNSYRLGEVLQMGMIPVYVYNDLIWLPYYNSIDWRSFSYVSHIEELEQVLEGAKHDLTTERVIEMREKVRSLYNTHWTSEGVIQQILNLLNFGFDKSDLRCGQYSALRNGISGGVARPDSITRKTEWAHRGRHPLRRGYRLGR
jgi:hypothetical protein